VSRNLFAQQEIMSIFASIRIFLGDIMCLLRPGPGPHQIDWRILKRVPNGCGIDAVICTYNEGESQDIKLIPSGQEVHGPPQRVLSFWGNVTLDGEWVSETDFRVFGQWDNCGPYQGATVVSRSQGEIVVRYDPSMK